MLITLISTVALIGALIQSPSTTTSERRVVISKQKLQLYVVEGRDTLAKYPIAVGLNYGHKQRKGDKKTPEGTFTICQIQDARTWTHDFGDGKGQIAGAYGAWFIRLKTPPFTGIGIHGTHNPASIGTHATEGCIRLRNEDLVVFKNKYAKIGMTVIIEPDR